MEAEEQDVQRFLDSTANAIELNMFSDLIIDLAILRFSCFMRYAVLLLAKVFIQSGLIMRSTRSKARADHPRTTRLGGG